MARWKPTRCRDCGTREGHISYRALCELCGRRRMMRAAVEMHRGEGPHVDRWREGYRRMLDNSP